MDSPENPLHASNASPGDISAGFTSIRDSAEVLKNDLRRVIKDGAEGGDAADLLLMYTRALKEVEVKLHALGPIEEVLVRIARDVVGLAPNEAISHSAPGLRRITIEVSEGMLNQSLLTVTDARKLGIVSLGERLKVTLPGGVSFETEVVEPGNRLRERGLIRSFYRDQRIEAGDYVVLSEVARGEWTLEKHIARGNEYMA